MGSDGFRWVIMGYDGLGWVRLGLAELYRVVPSCTELYRVLFNEVKEREVIAPGWPVGVVFFFLFILFFSLAEGEEFLFILFHFLASLLRPSERSLTARKVHLAFFLKFSCLSFDLRFPFSK